MGSAPLRTEVLLRYRFETFDQIRNHLHQQEVRSVFFFRDPALTAEGNDRVVLELSAGDQQMVLRGIVLTRDNGGVWLEFADSRLARRLSDGDVAARRQRRLPMDLLVELRSRTARVGRLLDVSMGGARLGGVQGLAAGMVVDLRLLTPLPDVPASLGRADVIRAGENEAALRFIRSDPPTRVAVTRLFDAARKAWLTAPEVIHPAGCCIGNIVSEPPLPRLRKSEGRLA